MRSASREAAIVTYGVEPGEGREVSVQKECFLELVSGTTEGNGSRQQFGSKSVAGKVS
jgi:hypothetical protein